MGNCTATVKHRHAGVGASVEVTADVALSTSYATGGDTIPLNIFPLDTIHALVLCSSNTTPGGHAVELIPGTTDGTAPKVRVRDVATGVELGAASNNAAQSVRVVAKGNYPGT